MLNANVDTNGGFSEWNSTVLGLNETVPNDNHVSLKDLEVNLNDLKILEYDFKTAVLEYNFHNYVTSYEIFLDVLDRCIKLNDVVAKNKALNYLSKIAILRGDFESALSYLSRLKATPKTLNLLVKCLLLQHEKTHDVKLLHISKRLLYLILIGCENEHTNTQFSNTSDKDSINFVFKNNLLLLSVYLELKEFVPYYSLLDKIRLFLSKYSKSVKNKHLSLYNKIANSTNGNKLNYLHPTHTQENGSELIIKEIQNKVYEELYEYNHELISELCKNVYVEEIALKLTGGVSEMLMEINKLYEQLEKQSLSPFAENILVMLESVEDVDHKAKVVDNLVSGTTKMQYTRQGQRDVKRRIMAHEGLTTKSIYLKNYWNSVCNFFYLADFNIMINNAISGNYRREEEGEDDIIYPSDIARFLKYSESYYSLNLIKSLEFKGKRRLSENSSLSSLRSFFLSMNQCRFSAIDFSLNLLEFMLKNHQINDHRYYQILLSNVYNYVHKTLVTNAVDNDCDKNSNSTTLISNAVCRYNNLFKHKSDYIDKFKNINQRLGLRLLFILFKNYNESLNKKASDQSPRNSLTRDECSPGQIMDRAYFLCLFNLYKLSAGDYFKKIHIIYFHMKKLSMNRLDANDSTYKLIHQYKYIAAYNHRHSLSAPGSAGPCKNMSFDRKGRKEKNGKFVKYIDTLLTNMGNIVLNEGNLEQQLDRYIKKFFIVLAKNVDLGTVKQVYAMNHREYHEAEIEEIYSTYERYLNKYFSEMFYNELQQFLVEITSYICSHETMPSWVDKLLMLYGDILSVHSLTLHKNTTNIQVSDTIVFSSSGIFDQKFMSVFASTLLILINRLYFCKYSVLLDSKNERVHAENIHHPAHNHGLDEPNGRMNKFASCLKEMELVYSYSLVLNNVIARIYTNIAFITYYLIQHLIADQKNQDSKIIYYLYVTFSQIIVIVLSSFVNVNLYTHESDNIANGAVKVEMSYLLQVISEPNDSSPSSANEYSMVEDQSQDQFEPIKLINKNLMEYYYTYNNILDSLLQMDLQFKENDLTLDSDLIPKRLHSHIYLRNDGTELTDSNSGINLNLSTTIFNRIIHLFYKDFIDDVISDLQIIHTPNHLISQDYLKSLINLNHRLKIQKDTYTRNIMLDGMKKVDLDEYTRRREIVFISAVVTLMKELLNKSMSTVVAKELKSPALSLLYFHFKKYDGIDNNLYLFRDLLDKILMPSYNGFNFFRIWSNPLIVNSFGPKELMYDWVQCKHPDKITKYIPKKADPEKSQTKHRHRSYRRARAKRLMNSSVGKSDNIDSADNVQTDQDSSENSVKRRRLDYFNDTEDEDKLNQTIAEITIESEPNDEAESNDVDVPQTNPEEPSSSVNVNVIDVDVDVEDNTSSVNIDDVNAENKLGVEMVIDDDDDSTALEPKNNDGSSQLDTLVQDTKPNDENTDKNDLEALTANESERFGGSKGLTEVKTDTFTIDSNEHENPFKSSEDGPKEKLGVSRVFDERYEDDFRFMEQLNLLDYVKYVSGLEQYVKSDDMFDYKDLVTRYKQQPKYDFMATHKNLYLKILRSYSGIDTANTFDIESYSIRILSEQLDVINFANVIFPSSFDVPFLAIIKNFELLMSIPDITRFHHKYSFYGRKSAEVKIIDDNSSDSTYGGTANNYGDGRLVSYYDANNKSNHTLILEIVKRLMHLVYVTLDKYNQFSSQTDSPAVLVDKSLIFFGDFENIEFNKEEIEDVNSFSYRFNTRVKLMHFIRISLLMVTLKRGLLIPSMLLFTDYYILIQNICSSSALRNTITMSNKLEDFVAFSPSIALIPNVSTLLYLIYLQIKIFDRIIKNVPLSQEMYLVLYSKILINYKRYIEILINNKLAVTDTNVSESSLISADLGLPTVRVKSKVASKRVKNTMNYLNQIFISKFESNNIDDELIIVYFKMHCARLRLYYINPLFNYILAPFSFNPEYNSVFNSAELNNLMNTNKLEEWSSMVLDLCSKNNIDNKMVIDDIIVFLNRIKDSKDNDIGCLVCYKLAYFYFHIGEIEQSINLLEEMNKKIIIPNDFIKFAVNFEITFIKSCPKIITNTCRILIGLTCDVIHGAKTIQDQHVLAFNERFSSMLAQDETGKDKAQNKVKVPKKGSGKWIYAGLEKLAKLDSIYRMIKIHIDILQKFNKKFREVSELDRTSLIYTTVNQVQNVIVNTLTYCFMFLVYACPHVLSLSVMRQVMDEKDVATIIESNKIVKTRSNHKVFMAETLNKLITTRADEKNVYAFLEKHKIFHHARISTEYDHETATLDLRIFEELFKFWNLKLFHRPLDISNKLSELFIDACNRLLYIVPLDESLLNDPKTIKLPSGDTVIISDEWALNQRITTLLKATASFNEAMGKSN